MKITTYNTDGLVLTEEDYKVQIPEYIQNFDDKNSFLNITDDEMELISSKEDSFAKTILLDRLTYLLNHDYCNYLHSVNTSKSSSLNIGVFLNISDEIEHSEFILHKFLKNFTKIGASTESMCNGELKTLSEGKWIEMLFYHSDISAYGNKKCDSHELAVAITWLNLLHRYYYALRHYDNMYGLPDDMKRQMHILKPFANYNKYGKRISQKEIISALHNIGEWKRSDLYRIFAITQMAKDTVETGMMSFEELSIEPETKKEYIFSLDNCYKRTVWRFKLDDDEICELRIGNESQVNKRIMSWLENIYKEYCDVLGTKYQNQIINKAKTIQKLSETIDWKSVYLTILDEWVSLYCHQKDKYVPQSCYYALVIENNVIGKEMNFNSQIVYDLVDVLKENNSESQQGLYESMIKLNYLNLKLGDNKGIVSTTEMVSYPQVEKAMNFIDCIIKFPYIKNGVNVDIVKNGIRELLSKEEIRTHLSEKFRGFDGGFHLGLLYNILGRLILDHDKKHDIFVIDHTNLDVAIAEANNQTSTKTGKLIDRRHFMENHNIDQDVELGVTPSFIKKYGLDSIVNDGCKNIISQITQK